ncbi:hypothetical protein OPQ81_010401 [Rhizoctonia solani]|nr:hypothetical protein OPQ81_010401 [Rhizoctonia solani]
MGVGLGQTAAGTYVAETTAPKIRPFALGLYFSCWAVGSLLAAGISYGCSSLDSNWPWRIPSLLQAAPSLGILFILPFLPESPRWLIFKDRTEDALNVIAKIMGTNTDDSSVQFQYQEMIQTLDDEKSETTFLSMLRDSANRKRLFLALSVALLAMLTGSNIITYYFGSMLTAAGISSSTTQLQINVILSSWQLVVALTGSVLAERLGRRALALTSLGACSVFFYMLAGLTAKYGSGDDQVRRLRHNRLHLPLPRLTTASASPSDGYGILIKTCGVFISFVFPYLFEAISWKTYIVNASWNIIIWLYVYFHWVETRGLTLEEVSNLFGCAGNIITGVSSAATPEVEKGTMCFGAKQQG